MNEQLPQWPGKFLSVPMQTFGKFVVLLGAGLLRRSAVDRMAYAYSNVRVGCVNGMASPALTVPAWPRRLACLRRSCARRN
jgi:hypothetical protein